MAPTQIPSRLLLLVVVVVVVVVVRVLLVRVCIYHTAYQHSLVALGV